MAQKPTGDVASPDFPTGVKAADTKYPTKGRYDQVLDFYWSERLGWCVATLSINARTGRTYAMSYDGSTVTMGGRPTGDKKVHVYVHAGNKAKLAKWLELWDKGANRASDIRDRIGSRRAQGQVMRAEGRTYWTWDK